MPVDAATWANVVHLAGRHRVTALLLHRLRLSRSDTQIPPELLAGLRNRERANGLRALQQQAAFLEFSRKLSSEGVRTIALKGLHIGATLYPSPGAREMYDIDVLVTRDDVPRALAAASALGFVAASTAGLELDLAAAHHLPPLVRRGVSLEIHWRLVSPATNTRPMDAVLLMRRAVPFRLAGTEVLGLASTDLLLHFCAHASHQHLFEQRLAAICDIALLVRERAIDWGGVAAMAREWGTERGTWLILRVAEVLGFADLGPAAVAGFRVTADDQVVAAALAQVFRPPDPLRISHHLTRLADPSMPLAARARLFVTRALLVGSAVREGGGGHRFLLLPRARRLIRLVRTYFTPMLRGVRADVPLADLAARRNAVSRWLAED